MNSQEERRKELVEERRRLKLHYGELFDEVSEILFRHDLEDINFEFNIDEYEPEVGTILPRLRSCSSAADAQTVIHEEFRWWFTPEVTPPFEAFSAVAEDIWQAWTRYREQGGAA